MTFERVLDRARRLGDRGCLVLLVVTWALGILIVSPVGDFPAIDDWAYAWTVKQLVETGDYQLSDWTATNLLPQALWGALFAQIFGFSFTTLRASTLLLGLIGVLATFGLFRQIGASVLRALLGAVLVSFNPIFFLLANTFNSDVPSYALFVSALYFMARGFGEDSFRLRALGVAVGCVGVLNRQSSIVLLVGYGCARLADKGLRPRILLRAALPVAAGVSTHLAYTAWLATSGRKPLLHGHQLQALTAAIGDGPLTVLSNFSANTLTLLPYLGLLLLPLLLLRVFIEKRTRQTLFSPALAAAASGALVGLLAVIRGLHMPLSGNILNYLGTGPLTIPGNYSALGESAKQFFAVGWRAATVAAAAGAALLALQCVRTVARVLPSGGTGKRRPLVVLLSSIATLHFLAIASLPPSFLFDRYLLPLLPLTIGLVLFETDPPERRVTFALRAEGRADRFFYPLAAASLLSVVFFAVAGTRDFMSANRCRWSLLEELRASHAAGPEIVDGGFEHRGWHFAQRIETCNPAFDRGATKGRGAWSDFTCLWNDTRAPRAGEHSFSFVIREGFDAVDECSYRRLLPWMRSTVYVLRPAGALMAPSTAAAAASPDASAVPVEATAGYVR